MERLGIQGTHRVPDGPSPKPSPKSDDSPLAPRDSGLRERGSGGNGRILWEFREPACKKVSTIYRRQFIALIYMLENEAGALSRLLFFGLCQRQKRGVLKIYPVASPEFPWHSFNHDEDGFKKRTTRSEVTKKQVSYRLPTSSDQEIRRAGEQTSPQVARAAGQPAKRDEGGGSSSGSSSIRRFRSRG